MSSKGAGKNTKEMCIHARRAGEELALASSGQKNKALEKMAGLLVENSEKILAANRKDVAAAKKRGISAALTDRLVLSNERIKAIAAELREVVALPDPVGEVTEERTIAQGLKLKKVRVPLGVVLMIYESRPNVTVDAAALCIKGGNAAILRGGSDAINSNRAIAEVLRNALRAAGLPQDAVQLVQGTDRKIVDELLGMHGMIDVVIPRGSGELIRHVVQNSEIPAIETGEGNCHIFVDESANLEKAAKIVMNAKCQRPGVCNAVETLLVHEKITQEFLPSVLRELAAKKVEIRGCGETKKIAQGKGLKVKAATEKDWGTEFLNLILAVKVVSGVDEAVAHINKYGTKHSEAIISESAGNIAEFFRKVDAAVVYSNTSTRFTDGNKFGLGAEIGISTQKLHARGPMGVRELTSYKYIVEGSGQARD